MAMSKESRRKSRNRRKHTKKSKGEKSCLTDSSDVEDFRFVTYMREDDARDFSGVLCEMNNNVLTAKYKTFHFEKIMYTQIILYVKEQYLKRAYDIIEHSRLRSVGSRHFYMPKCHSVRSSLVNDAGLCVVGCITHETVDQFKGDARESSALSDSELFFYQMPNSLSVIVEIYTNDINREFAIAVLEDGWMSEKWGSKFKKID